MKQLIFCALLGSFSLFLQAQSSKSIGLVTSYNFNKNTDWVSYQTPQVGLAYNHFFNKKHGVVTELGMDLTKDEFTILRMDPIHINRKHFNLNYSIHYIFKHKQFFIKSGFNARMIDFVRTVEESVTFSDFFGEEEVTLISNNTSTYIKEMQTIPEFHLALGRDFSFERFDLRINSFLDVPLDGSLYLSYGGTVGLFYKLSNEK